MTDKEYNSKVMDIADNVGYLSNGRYSISSIDYGWLIQQAERAQELENQLANERSQKLTYRKVAQRHLSEKNRYQEALRKIVENTDNIKTIKIVQETLYGSNYVEGTE